MKRLSIITGLAIALSLTTGCVEGSGDSNNSSKGQGSESGNDFQQTESGGLGVVYKTSVQYASVDDLLENQAECNGNSDQICVYVCHRPPGNPENSKTKVLPIKALNAHLNHGAAHHNDHDYIGPCVESSDDGSGDDPDIILDDPDGEEGAGNDGNSGDGGSNDDGSNDGSDSNEEVPDDAVNDGYGTDVPVWCEPFYSVDQNCDGYNDDDFQPTL